MSDVVIIWAVVLFIAIDLILILIDCLTLGLPGLFSLGLFIWCFWPQRSRQR